MTKKIVWVTPIFCMDNNKDVVPYLSKYFDIHWIIVSSELPANAQDVLNMKKSSLTIEYYLISDKWYNPVVFLSYKRLYSHIKELSGDTIYYNKAPQLWEYYAARLYLPRKKIVFALHNVKVPKGARYETMARFYMRKMIRHFTNFHVFSLNQKNYLESISSGKNILYAELPLLNFGNKLERKYYLDKVNFLAFGFIRRYKRFDLLIDAAQALYEETKVPFTITIIGQCKNWEIYQNRIRYPELFNLNIGYVDDEDIPSIFSNCDYLVLPYQDLAQSGPLMLAFYYNVPVIASDIAAFREFIQEGVNGFFFESENSSSLKDLMKRLLLLDKSQKEELVSNVKKYTDENHSLESLAIRYNKYFNRLEKENS